VTGASTPVADPQLSGDRVYWLESRPNQGGRMTLMSWDVASGTRELVPEPFNVRTRVNAYGGGAYFLNGETVFFSNFADQRIYRMDLGHPPAPITPVGNFRYADCALDSARGRAICVREEHTAGGKEPVDTLVAVDLQGRAEPRVLAFGHDFFASPRVLLRPQRDGEIGNAKPDELVWLTWDHPQMPWDGTDLWRAVIQRDGSLSRPEHVAGGPQESIFQPEWSPDGALHFVSDRSGYWNIYRWAPAKDGAPNGAAALAPMRADFGRAQFVFRLATYGFAGNRIIATYQENGAGHIAAIDPANHSMEQIDVPYDTFWWVSTRATQAVFIAGSPREPTSVVHLDLSSGRRQILARSHSVSIDERYLSLPAALSFSGSEGHPIHAYLYSPRNDDFAAPRGEKPPLIVRSHGGPTGRSEPVFSPETQFWTSRGFAVLDVNYGGSTGYGRAYRQRLYGRWGEVDVDDCIAAAKFVVERGGADGARLLIRGGSAGGYTTLAALAFRNVFRAGASLYGVSDLELLEQQMGATDKLEAHYTQRLVGPYPARRDLFIARSPLHSASKIDAPVIFFQGVDDDVVPVNQARLMYAALKKKGLPTALIEFPGEGHGFRKAENIRRVLNAELYFYTRVLGIPLPAPVEPVEIDNLPRSGMTK
jgi:dipeptidyl aminopeptidase/acylaminoacyl peptidase